MSEAEDFENPVVTTAILTIKKNNNMSLTELVDAYNQCPSNFCHSFTREQFKSLQNLPSTDLYPTMNRAGIAFEDIYPGWKDHAKNVEYPIKPIIANFVRHITIVKATGVPIPDSSKVNRKSEITAREIRACLFNRTTGKFVGGT